MHAARSLLPRVAARFGWMWEAMIRERVRDDFAIRRQLRPATPIKSVDDAADEDSSSSVGFGDHSDLDEEMSLSCFRAIACPVLAVQAADGWPRPEPGFTTRCEALGDRLTLVETSGSHYAHLDDDSAPEVEAALASFLAPLA